MARTETTGRQRHGPRRLLLPAATMAGTALVLSFGVTRAMERILSAQGGEAAVPLVASADMDDTKAERVPLDRRAYLDAIIGRDIFDSQARLRFEVWTPPVQGFPLSDTQLLATVVVEDHNASTALIATGSGDDTLVQVYGLGDALLGEGRITRIDQGRVTVHSHKGQVQHLQLGSKTGL